jgi:hypothetical protein
MKSLHQRRIPRIHPENPADRHHQHHSQYPAPPRTGSHHSYVQIHSRALRRHNHSLQLDFAEPGIRCECSANYMRVASCGNNLNALGGRTPAAGPGCPIRRICVWGFWLLSPGCNPLNRRPAFILDLGLPLYPSSLALSLREPSPGITPAFRISPEPS